MVPSSVQKIKRAEGPPELSVKSELPLKTTPVRAGTKGGLVTGVAFGGGIWTTNPCLVPVPSYKVETPARLSLSHQGLAVLRVKPQGFSRCPSVSAAVTPGVLPSVTRLV